MFAMGIFLPNDSSPFTVGNIGIAEEMGEVIDNEVDVPVDRDAEMGGSILLDADSMSVFWANGLVVEDTEVEACVIGFIVVAVWGAVILIKSK